MDLVCTCGQGFPSERSLHAHHRGCLAHQRGQSNVNERLRKQYHDMQEARQQRKAQAIVALNERQAAAREDDTPDAEEAEDNNVIYLTITLSISTTL
jgi:hypothetical protein